MPFVSPTRTPEQSPLALVKYLPYSGLRDIELSTAAKPLEDESTVYVGTNVVTKTYYGQVAPLPNPSSTICANQLVDAYPNAQPLLSSDEDHNTPQSAEADSHAIVRKKSGEIVKSSLKNGRLRERARSLPSTPTCSKGVHFDAQLERVRHFFYSERPTAISKDGSPTDEYPVANFSCFTDIAATFRIEHSPFSCSSESPVYTEALHLSSERNALVGQILVKNIAYHKIVVVRFTFDHWRTISETNAFYETRLNDGTTPKDHKYDRFTFSIKLQDFTNVFSTSQCMDFCVRYNVADQEFWDNNFGNNYRVSFSKRLYETEHLKRTKSCPPRLNTETCPPTLHGFFDLFNDHLESMADFDDTELWTASFKRHGIRGSVCENPE